MGAIKTSKLDNGMVGIEITYGGKDSPFGGTDYSAPAPYIEPNCFADASGFLIIDDVLVAHGWFPLNIVLSGWTSDMTYMDSGHFYQDGNYWNWALAVETASTPASGAIAAYTDCTYTIWTWQGLNPGTVPVTTTLTVRQSAIQIAATPSQAAVELVGSPASGTSTSPNAPYVASFWVQFNNNNSNQESVWVSSGDTPATIASNAVTWFNKTSLLNTIASFEVDPSDPAKILINPLISGSAGNSPTLTVQSWVKLETGTNITCPSPVITQQFAGGVDEYTQSYGIPPNPTTWVCVGETLYIGGYGTMILQYTQSTGVPQFSICTSYLGAICLGKFNSQLIAAGIVPGPGSAVTGVIPTPEMILGWSAPEEYSTWNPEKGDGTVTGAGYNRISDVSDYLTGIFLTPGTAVILRTQGIDYITPLSGGISPFDFAHISNALQGEGCQHFKLVTEYDQVGAFVGNTNVFQFSGSISPIGDKIKSLLFQNIWTHQNRDSASGPHSVGFSPVVLSIFVVNQILFIYNYNNKSWMPYYLGGVPSVYDIEWLAAGTIPPGFVQEYVGFNAVLVTQDSSTTQPLYWHNRAIVQDSDFPHATADYIVFPAEEISFGRDITIESAYVSVAGTPGQVVNFWVQSALQTSVLQAQLVLPATASVTVYANYQIWFVAGSPDDKMTVQSPQLVVSLPLSASGTVSLLKISKIALFGSFDPAQRPV